MTHKSSQDENREDSTRLECRGYRDIRQSGQAARVQHPVDGGFDEPSSCAAWVCRFRRRSAHIQSRSSHSSRERRDRRGVICRDFGAPRKRNRSVVGPDGPFVFRFA